MRFCDFFLLFLLPLLASCAERKVYIVYFGEHSGQKALHEIEDYHHSYLLSVKASEEEARDSLLYSYKHSINGFAAVLSPHEVTKLSEMDEVVSVFPSQRKKHTLHTTRSWEFVGLEKELGREQLKKQKKTRNLLEKARYGDQIIVGMVDNGVWPESKSFSDEGMGPIPKSWKGICQTGVAFNSSHCNRHGDTVQSPFQDEDESGPIRVHTPWKLIGARYYLKGYESDNGPLNTTTDYRSPRDKDGHGTHTASTVAGRRVHNVSALGYAPGTASGGAPLARLAIYKVCWPIPGQTKVKGNTCYEEDMLAAIDDAMLMEFIAGNSGPAPSTLSNPAPWIITVGASSIDRAFVTPLVLGNGMKLMGQSVTPYKLKKRCTPWYSQQMPSSLECPRTILQRNLTFQNCNFGSLDPKKVKGKIVLCLRGGMTLRIEKGIEVKRAGGVGFILGNTPENGFDLPADPHLLPATAVSSEDVTKIRNYIKSTKKPMATIIPGRTVLHAKPAPFMASFISRGPNTIDPNILKHGAKDHPLQVALLKAIHPNWSSAAIRSALMTTAGLVNNIGKPITDSSGNPTNPFQYGSGHFRPTKAADPGLVYDTTYTDYLLYLCNIGVKSLDSSFKCPKVSPSSNNLNYPSLQISKLKRKVTVTRTATNVGSARSIYFSSVKSPVGFSVRVEPSILYFNHVGQKKSFDITVEARNPKASKKNDTEYAFGWYTWNDGIHNLNLKPPKQCGFEDNENENSAPQFFFFETGLPASSDLKIGANQYLQKITGTTVINITAIAPNTSP
ncbi:Subtilisin-like protease SBT5.6 [Vitis vinifera]|uniref:Subtilisin-like protease SBT5.6 n=1 Tax=Vitis vinifera TaxID=29760 RepID=A0A438D2A8_VITVI|nr:Subtilisin-like protease SBT5.6 [Vitis vinifera]